MSKSRIQRFNGPAKRFLDGFALGVAINCAIIPEALAAVTSMVDPNTRDKNPYITFKRGNREFKKIRSLAHFAELGLANPNGEAEYNPDGSVRLKTQGTNDDRASKAGKVMRMLLLDDLPQLRDARTFMGPREYEECDIEKFEAADRTMWREYQGKIQDYQVRSGLFMPSNVMGKGIRNPHHPDALRAGMRANIDYLDNWSLAREAWTVTTVLPRVISKIILPKTVYPLEAQPAVAQSSELIFDYSNVSELVPEST